jgi:hypothetical protein
MPSSNPRQTEVSETEVPEKAVEDLFAAAMPGSSIISWKALAPNRKDTWRSALAAALPAIREPIDQEWEERLEVKDREYDEATQELATELADARHEADKAEAALAEWGRQVRELSKALAVAVLAGYYEDSLPGDLYADPFEAEGLLETTRDATDEYVTNITSEGRQFLHDVLTRSLTQPSSTPLQQDPAEERLRAEARKLHHKATELYAKDDAAGADRLQGQANSLRFAANVLANSELLQQDPEVGEDEQVEQRWETDPDKLLRLIWREKDGERRRCSAFILLDKERTNPDLLAALGEMPRNTAYLASEVEHMRLTQPEADPEVPRCGDDYERVARSFHAVIGERVAWQEVPVKTRALMIGTVRRLAETGVFSIPGHPSDGLQAGLQWAIDWIDGCKEIPVKEDEPEDWKQYWAAKELLLKLHDPDCQSTPELLGTKAVDGGIVTGDGSGERLVPLTEGEILALTSSSTSVLADRSRFAAFASGRDKLQAALTRQECRGPDCGCPRFHPFASTQPVSESPGKAEAKLAEVRTAVEKLAEIPHERPVVDDAHRQCELFHNTAVAILDFFDSESPGNSGEEIERELVLERDLREDAEERARRAESRPRLEQHHVLALLGAVRDRGEDDDLPQALELLRANLTQPVPGNSSGVEEAERLRADRRLAAAEAVEQSLREEAERLRADRRLAMDDANRLQDHAERFQGALERIATGRGAGATTEENLALCRQIAEETLASILGPHPTASTQPPSPQAANDSSKEGDDA